MMLIISLVIFLLWIPYFLINYPGVISNDVVDQLRQFMGINILNDHHPVLHTIFIGFLYKLFLFGGSNFAVACTTLVQMVLLSLMFGYLIYTLYNKGLNRLWCFLILVFYATPIFGIFATSLWKDSMFAGLVVLFIISIMKLCDDDKKGSYIMFVISSILMLFFRNNAIYMYFIFIIFSVFMLRKKRKYLIISLVIVLGVYFTIKGPVYNKLNIAKSSTAEYIAIPLEQIGRMVSKDVYISEEDKKLIDDVIDLDTLKKVYSPYTSDTIKFNSDFDISVYDNNKSTYNNLWVRNTFKHLDVAIDSYLMGTIGYWYVDTYTYMQYDVVAENDLGIYADPKVPNVIIKGFNILRNRKIPLLSLEYGPSFALCLTLLAFVLSLLKKNKKYLLCYIPVLGLWLSIMVATPVYAEFRYIFFSYALLPIMIFIPFKKVNQ